MIMANGTPEYECHFYEYDDGFSLPAKDEDPADLVSLINKLAERSRGDYSENVLPDISCSESDFHGANEHSDPHIGSLEEASAFRTFCSRGSFVTKSQTFSSGFENLEPHQDVFPMNFTQDFFPFSNQCTIETNFERDDNHDTFRFASFSNVNNQMMDKYGISDGNYKTLESPDTVENHSWYSDIHDPRDQFSVPYITSINEPFFSGSWWMQSTDNSDDILFNIKTDSEEHLTQNMSINSNTSLAIGESSFGQPAKESTSGYRGLHRCNNAKIETQVGCVDKEKRVTNMRDNAKIKTEVGCVKKEKCVTNMRNNAKIKRNDEQSGQQTPLQDFSHRKSDISLQDGGLAVPLLKHQRIALSWMVKKETKNTRCCGGILADDQGLGKTISAIALILKERDDDMDFKQKNSLAGGTLVVCPTSVLRQWNQELQNKVTNKTNLKVLVYYGGNRTKDPVEVANYDVVLTTYAIISTEVPKQSLFEQQEEDDETKNKKRKHPLPITIGESSRKGKKGNDNESFDRPLAKVRWFRVILDEAQTIKNYKTQVARACWGLKAKRRWCLSGTPIQNSIDDLYSYFRFLRYHPFAIFKKFCSEIKYPIQRNPVSGYKKLQLILKTIMLRRTKRTLVKGEPIISLPPKTITLKKIDFSEEERSFYRSLEAESRVQFAKYAAAGTVKQNYINILLMLLRLRQACDHPLLVKEKPNRVESSLQICSICNDPPEDAVVTNCDHVFCNQCILDHLSSDDNTQCPFPDCKNVVTKFNGTVDSLKVNANKAFDSSKVKATLEVLHSISKPEGILGNSQEKAIVFSQWTRMLDLLEVCLKDSSIEYRRLDGTMSVVARDKAVNDFNTLPEVTVMIMSLKAACLGLNMVAACHVILLDLWWNPTTEDQAIDRAHRIGQTRPVKVLRFTVKDTVEDRILALQEKKREMVASAFGDDENGGSGTRLTVEDMKYLFNA